MSVRTHQPTMSQNPIPDSVSTPQWVQITGPITSTSVVLQWTDPAPPATRNYDPHVNGQDPGASVQNVLTKTVDISSYISGTNGTVSFSLEYFDDGNTSDIKGQDIVMSVEYDLASVPSGSVSGKLWGNTHAVTNNTNQHLGENPNHSKAHFTQAIPFWSIHSTINGFQLFMRPDNQAGRQGHYTEGDGGTIKKMILGSDANGNPDLNNIIYETVEHAGDISQWGPIGTNNSPSASDVAAARTAHQAAYSGSELFFESARYSTGVDMFQHSFSNVSVTVGAKYWLAAQQVRGGTSNYPSVNYFRSGNSSDYAGNWLTRFQDATVPEDPIPMQQKSSGSGWINLNRHPVYTIYGNNGVQGVPYYNHGNAEGGGDRTFNVTSSRWVRNTWTVPAGGLTLNKAHLPLLRESGSGDVELRVDGTLVATFDGASLPQSLTDTYPAAFEPARWRSLDITPINVSGTAVLEVRATGSLNVEIGHTKEPPATQSTPYMEMQQGDCGTPDIISGTSTNSGGTWDDNIDANRIKFCICFNQT